MKHHPTTSYRAPDALEIFFKDVAQSSVIGGKRDYLPLTRRIERGRALENLAPGDAENLPARIRDAISRSFHELRDYVSPDELSSFIGDLGQEIETFLDQPDWPQPPALQALTARISTADDETNTNRRKSCWNLMWVLALLPLEQRQEWHKCIDAEVLDAHLEVVRAEHRDSKQVLIEGTLRYAAKFALHYMHTGIPYLDLVQEGMIGLMQAIDRFNESAGSHFQSYAATWIQQRITRYIADQSRLIRMPVHVHEVTSSIHRTVTSLREQLGREPSDQEIFLKLDWLTESMFQQLEDEQDYKMARAKLAVYEPLFSYHDVPLSEVPKDIRRAVLAVEDTYQLLLERDGEAPDEMQVLEYLGWLTAREIELIDKKPKASKSTNDAFLKAKTRMRNYRIAHAEHYPPDRAFDWLPRRAIENYLIAAEDTEALGNQRLLVTDVQEWLSCLSNRERDVINLRFGLLDGEERTLEEVGQVFGVTRERIRQIEAKVLSKLRHPARNCHLIDRVADAATRAEFYRERALSDLLHALDDRAQVAIEDENTGESARIQRLIDQFAMAGHSRRTSTNGRTVARTHLMQRILEEAGEPLHYSMIYERLLELLPDSEQFSKERTYAALFYSDTFYLFGEGVFGLATWDRAHMIQSGEPVLQHCPQPLLPGRADPRAFFESIMLGRDLLKRRTDLTARSFYMEMQAWAQKVDNNWVNAQSAFDAWYAAGLLDHIDAFSSNGTALQAAIPPDARLPDVRLHCLNALCRRVRKMSELLLTVKRIAPASVPDIQKILFGSERAGFDVSYRLNMLASFEAIQQSGDGWRLTPIGNAVLEANPPQELPDFSVIGEEAADADAADEELLWDDGLGLLEF